MNQYEEHKILWEDLCSDNGRTLTVKQCFAVRYAEIEMRVLKENLEIAQEFLSLAQETITKLRKHVEGNR